MASAADVLFRDFSHYHFYKFFDLAENPVYVRPTAERMREFDQRKGLGIDLANCLGNGIYVHVYKGVYVTHLGERFVCAMKIFIDLKLGYKECEQEARMLWKSDFVRSIFLLVLASRLWSSSIRTLRFDLTSPR